MVDREDLRGALPIQRVHCYPETVHSRAPLAEYGPEIRFLRIPAEQERDVRLLTRFIHRQGRPGEEIPVDNGAEPERPEPGRRFEEVLGRKGAQ